MYLKSVEGKILFEEKFSNIKQGVEMAVEDGYPLPFSIYAALIYVVQKWTARKCPMLAFGGQI